MDFRIESEDLRDAFATALERLAGDRPRRPSDVVDLDAGVERWRRLCDDGWFDAFLPTAASDTGWQVRGLTVAEALGARPIPEPVEAVAGFLLPLLHLLPGDRAADTATGVREGSRIIGVAPACLGADGRPVGHGGLATAPSLTEPDGRPHVSGEVGGVLLPPGATSVVLLASSPSRPDATSVLDLPLNRAGVRVEQQDSIVRGRTVARLTLDDVAITHDDVIVGPPADVSVAVRTAAAAFSRTLDGVAIGGATTVLERTLAYTGEREQFGARIGTFQAVKHQVADMAVLIEGARSLAYVAAWESDEHGVVPAAPTVAASRLTSASMYRRVTESGLQLRGATGFTWEDGTHWWLRAAMFDGSMATDREGLIASFGAALSPPVERSARPS